MASRMRREDRAFPISAADISILPTSNKSSLSSSRRKPALSRLLAAARLRPVSLCVVLLLVGTVSVVVISAAFSFLRMLGYGVVTRSRVNSALGRVADGHGHMEVASDAEHGAAHPHAIMFDSPGQIPGGVQSDPHQMNHMPAVEDAENVVAHEDPENDAQGQAAGEDDMGHPVGDVQNGATAAGAANADAVDLGPADDKAQPGPGAAAGNGEMISSKDGGGESAANLRSDTSNRDSDAKPGAVRGIGLLEHDARANPHGLVQREEQPAPDGKDGVVHVDVDDHRAMPESLRAGDKHSTDRPCHRSYAAGKLGSETTLCVTDEFFFDIAIDSISAGRVVIGVFGNVVPKSAANFRALVTCTGAFEDIELCYKGDTFHRIVRNFVIQGGSKATGRSIYGGTFREEQTAEHHSWLSHAETGVVSWAEYPIGSQFFILTGPAAAYLDQNHVVFGLVTEGMDLVERLGKLSVQDERPSSPVSIMDSGDLHHASS